MFINEYNLDIMEKDEAGYTAIQIAVIYGMQNSVSHLMEHYEIPKGKSCLHFAAALGLVEMVQHLIRQCGMPVDECNRESNTPLHVASLSGHTEAVIALLDMGSDPSKRGLKNQTPLLTACSHSHLDLTLALLKRKEIDITAEDEECETLLHLAAGLGFNELVEVLVSNYKCSLNRKNKAGLTPTGMAIKNGQLSTVCMLVTKYRGYSYTYGDSNDTLLNIAILNDCVNVAKEFVFKFDTIPSKIHKQGSTPIHLANK